MDDSKVLLSPPSRLDLVREAFGRASPKEFEVLVGCVFYALGHRVEHTGSQYDGGVDLRLFPKEPRGATIIVQCKKFSSSKVSSTALLALNGSLRIEEKVSTVGRRRLEPARPLCLAPHLKIILGMSKSAGVGIARDSYGSY